MIEYIYIYYPLIYTINTIFDHIVLYACFFRQFDIWIWFKIWWFPITSKEPIGWIRNQCNLRPRNFGATQNLLRDILLKFLSPNMFFFNMYWLYLAWKEKVWTWYVHLFFSKSSSIYVASQETDTFCAEMSWQPKDADWKLPQCEVEQANLPKIACLNHTYFRFTVSYKHVQTRKNIITNISCFLAMPMSTSCPPGFGGDGWSVELHCFSYPRCVEPQWWMDGSQTGWGNEELFKKRWNDEMMYFTYSDSDSEYIIFMHIYIYMYFTYWFYVYIYISHMYILIIFISI